MRTDTCQTRSTGAAGGVDMVARSRRRLALSLLLGTALLVAACTEPVDCAAEPHRCPLVSQPAGNVPAPVLHAPEPLIANARARRADQQQARKDRAAASKDAEEAKLMRARVQAEAERLAKEARVGDLSPKEQLHRTPEMLVRRIRNVAANRNIQGLRRFMTPDFRKRVDVMLGDSPERFWRHLARYVNAAEHGFELTSKPGPREGTLQLAVKGRGEMTLRPIVERSPEGWLFDRF